MCQPYHWQSACAATPNIMGKYNRRIVVKVKSPNMVLITCFILLYTIRHEFIYEDDKFGKSVMWLYDKRDSNQN